MPDDNRPSATPRDWGAAFAAMPLERPDVDAWAQVAARLPMRPRAQWPVRLAIAAALALAVILPLRLLGPIPTQAPPAVATTTTPATTTTKPASVDPLDALYAESAQLESFLAVARDDRVSSGAAAEVAVDLDRQLARIDAELADASLPRDRQLALWQERVDTLRASVGFESTRRWLAAQGERYDGALVRVD